MLETVQLYRVTIKYTPVAARHRPRTYRGVTGSFQIRTPHTLATMSPDRRTSGDVTDNGAPALNAPYKATATALNARPTPRA